MKLVFRTHAIQRMFERQITPDDIRAVLTEGETIALYSGDVPYPSRLVLGWVKGRAIHVVVAERPDSDEMIVITAYEPSANRWQDGYRQRKP